MKLVRIDSIVQFIDGIEINGVSGVGNNVRIQIPEDELPKLKPYIDKMLNSKVNKKIFYTKERSERVLSHYKSKK